MVLGTRVEEFFAMSFYRKNWYYLGGALFVALAFFVGFWGNQIDQLRKTPLLSFMALLMHQFEEYAIPGGFPAVFNIGWNHETEAPDRYPLNRPTCVCVNTFLAYPFYILPIVFPKIIWLGLAQILFGMAGQLFVHGIVINRKLHSYYNPGLAVTVLLHVPIGVYYIRYVYAHGLIKPWHWVAGILASGLAMVLVVGLPVRFLRDRNSPYPFDPDENGALPHQRKIEEAGSEIEVARASRCPTSGRT